MTKASSCRVAILVPCYNEAITIGTVITGFRSSLPDAEIYVYDNNSSDGTSSIAEQAGAIVRREHLQGKGNVVRRMFADVDADVYVMVDGDATYDPWAATKGVSLIRAGFDMVNIARESSAYLAYRPGHRFGNWLLTSLVGWSFGTKVKDMLSGYKVFSRRFVKSFPAISSGFEIETELIIHALEMGVSIKEFGSTYAERPEGSTSKLSTFKDGWRILRMIGIFIKNEKPLPFFCSLAALLALTSLLLGAPVIYEYIQTGLVPRLPTAILSASIMLLAVLAVVAGLILDVVTLSRREMKRLVYLNTQASHLYGKE
jgi:glycosyltransferase involved in cell wall biosynthesis